MQGILTPLVGILLPSVPETKSASRCRCYVGKSRDTRRLPATFHIGGTSNRAE